MALTAAAGANQVKPMTRSTHSSPSSKSVVTQYAHHGYHNETEVRDHFHRATQRFANARIRSFLPILIERAVKAKLT